MPEGHSLELASRRLRPLVGEVVSEGPLSGATVVGVEARGKHLLVHADDGRSLHAHLGLHGSVRLAAPGAGRGRHVLRTAAGDAVIRGRLEVVPAARLRLALGPDLLRDFDEAEFLRRARLVDRPVGEAAARSARRRRRRQHRQERGAVGVPDRPVRPGVVARR